MKMEASAQSVRDMKIIDSRSAGRLKRLLGRGGSHEQEAAPPHLAELSRLCSSISIKLLSGGGGRGDSGTLLLGDGSADHGDKHTGHVRKTVQDT